MCNLKIGLSRKSTLDQISNATTIEFVSRFLATDSREAFDLLFEYEDSPLLLDAKITALGYCSRHLSEELAEQAALTLCEILNRSHSLIKRSRRRNLRHIRWLRKCRRACRTELAIGVLQMALLLLGDRKSHKHVLKEIVQRDASILATGSKDSVVLRKRRRAFDGVKLMRLVDFLYHAKARICNRVLFEVGHVAKQQWIRINVGTMLLFNGSPSGLNFLSKERENVSTPPMEKHRILFGLAWGGVADAAEEFKQLAFAETEQIKLNRIPLLCHRYGETSRSHRSFFEIIKANIEGRIDNNKLTALRELR